MIATANKIAGSLQGSFPVPGDKSISHRALMFSALAKGSTNIYGLLESEDVLATMKALQNMGVSITKNPNMEGGEFYRVTGRKLFSPKEPLDLGNSGTSARLLMGVIAGHDIKACITGDASLSFRPMERITTPLSKMGAVFEQEGENPLPLWCIGKSELSAISYDMPVASAQLKSAIILAGLNAKGTTKITEPHASRDHTECMLKAFGVNVESGQTLSGRREVTVTGPVELTSPTRIDVPADPSAAAFMTVAAILYPNSNILLPNICMNPTRAGLYTILMNMGADITLENKRDLGGEPIADLHVQYNGVLNSCTVPAVHVPSMIDEYPILAIAASMANGTTRMEGLSELRVKESNRLEKIATGLELCGVKTEIDGDDLIVYGLDGIAPKGGVTIETGFDHRIAMSFLVLGGITRNPISIDNAAAIATSFPNFIKDMNNLGANITQ